jgi:mycothiol synthase
MCPAEAVAVGPWREAAPPWPALEAFVAANAVPRLPADPLWILNVLVADRGKVVVAAAAGRPLAVAAVVDAGEAASGAAELLLLAALPGPPDAALAVALAAAAAPLTDAPGLELALAGPFAAAEPALRAAGFVPAYATFEMRAGPPFGGPAPPIPAGFAWADLGRDSIDEYEAAVREAFAGVLGVRLPPPAVLQAAALRHRPPIRLLRRGGEVAGFVRVGLAADGTGRIELLGRRRRHRGRGLGRCLLAQGMQQLRQAGAGSIGLEVVAGNDRALALYRAAGFSVVEETRTLVKRRPRSGGGRG